jgi:3-dehydroquinate synthase
MNQTVVSLRDRQYSVYFQNDMKHGENWIRHHVQRQILIITNACVAHFFLEKFVRTLPSTHVVATYYVPDGEQAKSLTYYEAIIKYLIENHYHRDTTLIGLGGGVIGDLTGFVAATYCRGVPYIHIPTTLLAQVDSSIGGKTGINHVLGKNMMGAVYQPTAVGIFYEVLLTLPERTYVAGLAEVVKYGLIQDANFFEWIEQNTQKIKARDQVALMYLIQHCCEIKAAIVAQDEHDHGVRRLLNFGHTFGHALEAASEYCLYLHGEAVSVGMVMASRMSNELGYLSSSECLRIEQLLVNLSLPVKLFEPISILRLRDLMARDKKNSSTDPCFILLDGIGKAKLVEKVSSNLINKVVNSCYESALVD